MSLQDLAPQGESLHYNSKGRTMHSELEHDLLSEMTLFLLYDLHPKGHAQLCRDLHTDFGLSA